MKIKIENVIEFQQLRATFLKIGLNDDYIMKGFRDSVEYFYSHGTEIRVVDLENLRRFVNMFGFSVENSSANIREVLYSEITNTLYITFLNKKNNEMSTYSYEKFNKKMFESFEKAESKGGYFQSKINKKYKTKKL